MRIEHFEAAYHLEELVGDALEDQGGMTPEAAAEYAFHFFCYLRDRHLDELAEILDRGGPETRLEELRIMARFRQP